MNRELKEYLDHMESLVGHPGWKYITEDAQRQIYQFQADALDKNVAKTWDDVLLLRGKAETLAELIRIPEVIANQREAADAPV